MGTDHYTGVCLHIIGDGVGFGLLLVRRAMHVYGVRVSWLYTSPFHDCILGHLIYKISNKNTNSTFLSQQIYTRDIARPARV
jgi:hypothetical protein